MTASITRGPTAWPSRTRMRSISQCRSPGSRGNPAGRPRGARNRTTLAAEVLLGGQIERLTQKAIDAALGGDIAALRLCLQRAAPASRSRPIELTCRRSRTRTTSPAFTARSSTRRQTGRSLPRRRRALPRYSTASGMLSRRSSSRSASAGSSSSSILSPSRWSRRNDCVPGSGACSRLSAAHCPRSTHTLFGPVGQRFTNHAAGYAPTASRRRGAPARAPPPAPASARRCAPAPPRGSSAARRSI